MLLFAALAYGVLIVAILSFTGTSFGIRRFFAYLLLKLFEVSFWRVHVVNSSQCWPHNHNVYKKLLFNLFTQK